MSRIVLLAFCYLVVFLSCVRLLFQPLRENSSQLLMTRFNRSDFGSAVYWARRYPAVMKHSAMLIFVERCDVDVNYFYAKTSKCPVEVGESNIKRGIAKLKIPNVICLLCFVVLCGCTYGPPEVHSHITNVTRAPGKRVIAVMVARQEMRQPTGISKFPDGGSPKILSQEAIIYMCDIDAGSIKRLATYRDDGGQGFSSEPWLNGWKEDRLYFSTSGCEISVSNECWEHLRTTRKFELVISEGKTNIIDRVPDGVVADANSPLAPNPGEQNYLRYSKGYNSIDITTLDDQSFHPAFKVSDDGVLSAVERKS